MGRKGVSKRKPKKDRLQSNPNTGGTPRAGSGEHTVVASLVNDNSKPLNRGGMNPSAGSNKNRNKGK